MQIQGHVFWLLPRHTGIKEMPAQHIPSYCPLDHCRCEVEAKVPVFHEPGDVLPNKSSQRAFMAGVHQSGSRPSKLRATPGLQWQPESHMTRFTHSYQPRVPSAPSRRRRASKYGNQSKALPPGKNDFSCLPAGHVHSITRLDAAAQAFATWQADQSKRFALLSHCLRPSKWILLSSAGTRQTSWHSSAASEYPRSSSDGTLYAFLSGCRASKVETQSLDPHLRERDGRPLGFFNLHQLQ